ncbi:MAG: PAS domain S-box protein [Bacteroidales bacterium]|nr:PAS domain S-box protein [Bacteroidales bacterium]
MIKKTTLQGYVVILAVSLVIFLLTNVIAVYSYYENVFFESFIQIHREFPVMYVFNIFIIIGLPLIGAYVYYRFYELLLIHESENNQIKESINASILYTKKLIDNDLNFDLEVQSDDVLGTSLKTLRNRLLSSREEEQQRKKDDEQRNWSTVGLAKFADILRLNNNNNLTELGYSVVSNLVKYLDANQGGFYVYVKSADKNERDYFELSGCYAYERRRMISQKINIGDGLVGRCGIERESIYLTDIPKDYIKITSGLGKEVPTILLLVPLIVNDSLQGVMEIASFKELEKYQIEFIENVAEIAASTIAGVKINIQTAKLLEESRAQGAKLSRQEEEMRQNMEEMKMLQKEAALQSEEFVSFSNSVNHTMIRADFIVDGTLLYANTKFLNKLGYSGNSEVEGKSIFNFINPKDHDWFNKIWSNLSKGGRHYEGFMKQMAKDGRDVWTLSTYTCVKDDSQNVVKILFLAIDTTEFKKQSIRYEGMIAALNRSNLRAEFSMMGEVVECNTNYQNALDFSIDEITKLTIFELIDVIDASKIKKNWRQILKNIPYDETLKYNNKEGKEIWLNGVFAPVKDMYGDISSIVFMGHNISEQVLVERQVESQNAILKKQEKQLQENQLILEQKLKEATDEMRSQLDKIERIKILNEKTLEGALDGIFTFSETGKITFL